MSCGCRARPNRSVRLLGPGGRPTGPVRLGVARRRPRCRGAARGRGRGRGRGPVPCRGRMDSQDAGRTLRLGSRAGSAQALHERCCRTPVAPRSRGRLTGYRWSAYCLPDLPRGDGYGRTALPPIVTDITMGSARPPRHLTSSDSSSRTKRKTPSTRAS